MNVENIIREYVSGLAEEAQAQIQIDVANLEVVEFPCTEDDYVKLAVDATLMEDPIEALRAGLEAHAWVMTRESVKKEGNRIVDIFVDGDKDEALLTYAGNVWEEGLEYIKQMQNKKLVEMLIEKT